MKKRKLSRYSKADSRMTGLRSILFFTAYDYILGVGVVIGAATKMGAARLLPKMSNFPPPLVMLVKN